MAVLARGGHDAEHQQKRRHEARAGERVLEILFAGGFDRGEGRGAHAQGEQHGGHQEAERGPGGAQLQELGADQGVHEGLDSSPVSSKKTSSSEASRSRSSWTGQPLAEGEIAHRGGLGAGDHERPVGRRFDVEALTAQGAHQPLRAGAAHQHRASRRARDDLGERTLGHDLAAGDHDHGVGGLRHLGQHVARHQHGSSLCGVPAQVVAQPADALRIETVGGLVEDQDARLAEQRSGEGQPLAHAQRVLAGAPAAGVGEGHGLEHLIGARLGQACRARERAEVIAGPTPGMKARALEHGAHGARRVGEVHIGGALHGRRAARGVGEAEDHPQRRRLARSVGAEKAGDQPRLDLEADPVHRSHAAEALGQVAHLDRAHRCHLPLPGREPHTGA